MKRTTKAALAIVALLVSSEVGVRMAGAVDFPLYLANNRIGYQVQPNQSGSFLNKNDWAFNELSMGTGRRFEPGKKLDVLLVGDSIVLGGNPYRQNERLGPQLEKRIDGNVWPISAGSWGLQNELQYLREHPEVAKAVDRIVIVSNSADFDKPSSWASETSHPTKAPFSALWYLAQKYVLHPRSSTPNELVVAPKDPISELRDFMTDHQNVQVWLYPNLKEQNKTAFDQAWSPILSRLQRENIPMAKIHFLPSGTLTAADYRDEIHPTPNGTQKVASAISAGP